MWILKFFSFFFVFFAIGLCHEELQEFEDLEFTNFTLNFFNELISDVNQRSGEIDPRTLAHANAYFDKLFAKLEGWLIDHGYDPMKLPDVKKSFEYKFFFITYHGELTFTRGWLNDVSTLHRGGDTTIRYEKKLINIKVPIIFKTLLFDYQYNAKFMGLGPNGGVDGRLEKLKIYVDILLDLNDLELSLQDFQIVNSGNVYLRFNGHGLLDWFVNIISDVATLFLKGIITSLLEKDVRRELEILISKINKDISHIIN